MSTDLEAQLATLGVVPSLELALDATITPETLARSGGAAQKGSAPPAESVGPLPRIALSGIEAGRGQGAEATANADLEILGLLGEGGMGRVHLARQRSLGREVAIKTLKEEAADVHATEMLRVEATIMGRLEHPNVVPVHAVGHDGAGRLLLVMKRIDGAPWRDLLRDPDHPRWQALAPRREDRLDAHLAVLVQVANALELAHTRGVIHRDVKPENVLCGSHGEVYLADWGVALRMDERQGQELVGTPAYMAPEMVAGTRERIDARTDVFLLGATLYEVLTGAPPNRGATLQAALLAAYDPAPPTFSPEVPAELAAIATRAMAKRPEDRFASALDFRRAIDEVRNHRGSIALTRTARQQLEALESELADPDANASSDVDRRLTECRFALASALREWPENEEAQRAQQTCLRTAIRHELSRENASAARALLAELRAPDPALEAEVSALEVRVKARDAQLARLRALEADSDIRVGLGARVAMFGTLFFVGLGLSVFAALRTSHGDAIGAWDVVQYGAAVFGALLVVTLLFGRRLLANAAGRRITALFLLASGGLVLHRGIAAVHGVDPAATLTMDLVLLGVMCAAAGVVVPRVAWAALPTPFAIGLAFVFPERVPFVFSMTTLVVIAMIAVLAVIELRVRRLAARPGA